MNTNNTLSQILEALRGSNERDWLYSRLHVPAQCEQSKPRADRIVLSQALNMLLFHDLCERVPDARRYADEKHAVGEKVLMDHGALRTVAVTMQYLPSGRQAFSRLLEPLGYEEVGQYPLGKLRMCGYVYRHRDLPAQLSQFFVSELYPEQFSHTFQRLVSDLVDASTDPLSGHSQQLLNNLIDQGSVTLEESSLLLQNLLQCFQRQHDHPPLTTYRQLQEESAEMAWIATEGNAFNHATDRVNDLDLVAESQRLKGRPMKPFIEEGKHAHIRQTAYRATPVLRQFKDGNSLIEREVPGSFFEFIERGKLSQEQNKEGDAILDLRFDSANAQGIFKMTSREHSAQG